MVWRLMTSMLMMSDVGSVSVTSRRPNMRRPSCCLAQGATRRCPTTGATGSNCAGP
jgi:hypothetical protein